ncbi:hypothetical protein MKX08_000417 [Trichoderma sp. CBMAI-0020]|nr:hypothetical protein MKX08_000417 [Trichoderma sp. CBMAI-0020]
MMAAPAPRNHSSAPEPAAPRQFKKHRVLPRPVIDQAHDGSRRKAHGAHLTSGTLAPRSSTPHPMLSSTPRPVMSSQPLKHQLRRIGTGPDLPPTPPALSNASSSGQSATPSSPTSTENSSVGLPHVVANRPPATPPDQRGPPTPEVTPPHPVSVAKMQRPSVRGRMASESTNGPSSRAESFITAREEPTSSEDEAERPAGWPRRVSTTSQITITRSEKTDVANEARPTTPSDRMTTKDVAPEGEDQTPKAKGKRAESVGTQNPTVEAGHPQDARVSPVMTPQKHQHQRRPPGVSRPILHHDRDPVVKDKVSVTPTNATQAVRQMQLQEAAPVTSSSKRHDDQKPTQLAHPQVETTAKRNARPLSTSSQSTVVEVLLVDERPKRQRALRHMRKQSTLRHVTDNRENEGSVAKSADPSETQKAPEAAQSSKPETYDRESHVSTVTYSTNRSISSRSARQEIWRSGAIPVVIVPSRRSSRGPRSKEPSLRSTSSRHSDKAKSTKSTHSAPAPDPAPSRSSGPVFERPGRRSRAFSESDGSVRTIDFPPVIPARSSSLSAPTSRNVSRAGSIKARSIKAESIKAGSINTSSVKVHSTSIEQQSDRHLSQEVHIICPSTPSIDPLTPTSPEMRVLSREETFDNLGFSQHDDVLSVKRIPLRNTPFSVASMETCATAPELSEALAVHMFPHQNSSVLMVDHSNRPSEILLAKRMSSPPILMANSKEMIPITPPRKRFSSLEVDSPLRNPRAPPQPPKQPPEYPPAINFIPATPSGMTPAAERLILQGNYFESLKEKPPRRPSIVRRALSRRRHSIAYVPSSRGGFLARTFSMSRRNRDDSDISLYKDNDKPSEEDKLHPNWRPQWISDTDSEPMDDDGYENDDYNDHYERDDEVYRYPPVDNRPRRRTRSFSQKVKQTFTILPSREYHVDDVYGPQRRTIRRTSSGNLRIVRRVSIGSLKQRQGRDGNERYTVNGEPRTRFWRNTNAGRSSTRRFSIGGKLEDIQNIPHRISERRREKRSQRLRQMISGPKVVRDGVGEVIRR